MCSDAPDPPDYAAAAKAQGAANVEAAIAEALMNRPKETTPMGTREWTQYGTQRVGGYDIPLMESNINLTPEGQARYDQEQRINTSLGNVAEQGVNSVEGALGTEFNQSNLSARPDAPSVGGLQSVADALVARQQPWLDRDRAQLESSLVNQGFQRGSEGFDAEMAKFGMKENDARLAALGQAGQEQSRMYGTQAAERGRSLQEEMAMRQMPLNEMNALRSGSQVSMPQFQAYGQTNVGAAPVMQGAMAQGQADLNAWNADQAQMGNFMGGLFGLGSSALRWL